MEKGADVNHVQDSSELTPLTAFLSMQTSETDAEKKFEKDICELLIKHGAKILNNPKDSPLHAAVSGKKDYLIDLFLTHGADPFIASHSTDSPNISLFKFAIEHAPACFDKMKEFYSSKKLDDPKILEELITAGEDPFVKTELPKGKTGTVMSFVINNFKNILPSIEKMNTKKDIPQEIKMFQACTKAVHDYPEATLISHTDETGKVTTGKLSQLVRYLVEGNFIEAENFIRTENLLEHLNSQFLFEYDYTFNGKVRHSSDTSSLLGHLLKQDIYRTLNIADHGQIIDRQIQIIDFLFHIDPKLNLNNHRSGSDSDTPLYHALFNSPYFETIVPILLEKGADPFQTLSTSGSTHKSFNLFHHIFNHCKAEQINNMGGMTGYRYLSLFGDFVRE